MLRLDRSSLVAAGVATAIFLLALFSVIAQPNPIWGQGFRLLTKSHGWYFPYRVKQGRPLEMCPSFYQDRDAIMAGYHRRLGEINGRWAPRFKDGLNPFGAAWGAVGKASELLPLLAHTEAQVAGLHNRPCRGEWKYFNNSTHLLKWFLTEAPYVYLVGAWNVTPVYVAAAVRLVEVFGVMFLFLMVRRLSGSSLAGLIAYVMLTRLTSWPTDDFHSTFTLAFPLIYLGQLAASHNFLKRLRGRTRWLAESAIVAMFTVFALAPQAVYPPQYRVLPYIMIALVLFVGLIHRKAILWVRGLALAAVLSLALSPVKSAGEAFFPVSGFNHASGSDLAMVAAFVGNSERPNPYGIPMGDFATVHDNRMYCAFNNLLHGEFVRYQCEVDYGKFFLKDALVENPWMIFESFWKRLFLHTVFHDDLAYWTYKEHFKGQHDLVLYVFWWVVVTTAMIALVAAFLIRDAMWKVLPVVAGAFWSYYSIQTIFFYFRSHDIYLRGGTFILFCIFPGLIWFLVAHRRRLAGVLRSMDPRPALAERRNQAVLLLGLVVFGFATSYFVREARKELHAYNIIYGLFNSYVRGPEGLSPDELVADIEAIRALGGNPPGSVDMYAAQVFHAMYVWRYRAELNQNFRVRGLDPKIMPVYLERARRLRTEYFMAALKEAPDNPYYPVYAKRLNIPGWDRILMDATRRFPKSPYAAYMASHLANRGDIAPEDRRFFGTVFADNVSALLKSTADLRPGYQRIPRPAPFNKAMTEVTAEGLSVTLSPNEELILGPIQVFGSPKYVVGGYLKVLNGGGSFTALTPGTGRMRTRIGSLAAGQYFVMSFNNPDLKREVFLKAVAGAVGFRFVIRDLYPLTIMPRIPKPDAGV